MNQPQPLPLHDIHLPPPLSWWPLAPGWWYLLGLIIILSSILYFLVRWYKKGAIKREALICLQQIEEEYSKKGDSLLLVKNLSTLLRRMALSSFPREKVAGLTGESWLQFLDNHNWTKPPQQSADFQSGAGQILLTAPYQPQVQQKEVDALFALCKQWIKKSKLS
jgi:hypothetical protein